MIQQERLKKIGEQLHGLRKELLLEMDDTENSIEVRDKIQPVVQALNLTASLHQALRNRVQRQLDQDERIRVEAACPQCVDAKRRSIEGRDPGPPHAPSSTCRMGGLRPHCTCAGCW